MLVLEAVVATLKPGTYTIKPITMIRAQGTETCYDTRPLYGPDGKWLKGSERGPECPREHVLALRCGNNAKAHRHKDACFHRVHDNVEVPGVEVATDDGKFKARIFDGAECGSSWRNPNLVTIPRKPKLKPEGQPLERLNGLSGLEIYTQI